MIDEKFWQEYERANSNPFARFLNKNKIERMEKMIIESSTFVSKDSPEFEKWSSEINLSGINIESISLRQSYLEKQYSILSNSILYPSDKLSGIKENIHLIHSEKEANQEVFDTLEAFDYFDSLPENPDFVPAVTQAELLPNGWTWVEYNDGSGYLESPEGTEYSSYDKLFDGKIEYKNLEDNTWELSLEEFSEFKAQVEQQVVSKLGNQVDTSKSNDQRLIGAPVVEIRRTVSTEMGGLSTSRDFTR